MSHFAKVRDGIVVDVIKAEKEFFDTFIDTSPGDWIQTSYNTKAGIHRKPNSDEPSEDQSKALRKNFAGIGMIYDKVRDAFYAPQPYPSWSLNENSCIWEPPTPRPENIPNVLKWKWNEEKLVWEEDRPK